MVQRHFDTYRDPLVSQKMKDDKLNINIICSVSSVLSLFRHNVFIFIFIIVLHLVFNVLYHLCIILSFLSNWKCTDNHEQWIEEEAVMVCFKARRLLLGAPEENWKISEDRRPGVLIRTWASGIRSSAITPRHSMIPCRLNDFIFVCENIFVWLKKILLFSCVNFEYKTLCLYVCSEISGSQGCEYEEYSLLWYCAL